MRTWLALILALLLVAVLAVAPAAAAPGKSKKSAKPKLPIITTTSRSGPLQAAERRLALFIQLLQTGKRARCSSMFSKRMAGLPRHNFLANRWLTKPAKGRLSSVLFVKDLKLHANNIVDAHSIGVRVLPRRLAPGVKGTVGILTVTMTLENGKWMVFLAYGKI